MDLAEIIKKAQESVRTEPPESTDEVRKMMKALEPPRAISDKPMRVPFEVSEPLHHPAALQDVPVEERVLEKGNCNHLCKKCQKWWTHGLWTKCRFPDVMDQGMCPDCLNTPAEPLSGLGYTEENGKIRLTVDNAKTQADKGYVDCKNMSVEQITHHITFLEKTIQELRMQQSGSRRRRADLEEDQLQDIAPEDREKFRQELRRGSKEKKAAKAPKADPEKDLRLSLMNKGKSTEEAKVIAAMMIKTGKSQADVEAWLYD